MQISYFIRWSDEGKRYAKKIHIYEVLLFG